MTLHHLSHSVVRGGYLYIQKSYTPIDREALPGTLQIAVEQFKLLDLTLKAYEQLLLLFFMPSPQFSAQQIVDEIRRAITPFGTWASEYVFVTVDDLGEDGVRRELARLGLSNEDCIEPVRMEHNIAPYILQAVQELKTGKGKIALFLAGSKSALVTSLQGLPGYGGLFWHGAKMIEEFVTKLEQQGFLATRLVKTPEYSYPILVLTDEGSRALAKKQEIPVSTARSPPKPRESEQITYALFTQGKNPQQIATQRALQISTVYVHFIKFISAGRMNATQVVNSRVIKKVLAARSAFTKEPCPKELKELLPDVSYTEIRCVLADRTLTKQ